MILSCPACATRYTIDEAQLGPSGRTVRCAACKTTWHAEAVVNPIELPLNKPVPDKIEDLQAVKADKLPLKYRALVEDKKRVQALTTQGIIWGSVVAAMVLVLALAYVLRVPMVKAFPRVAGAYAMAGVPVNDFNLQFVSYNAGSAFKGGRFVVTVQAKVRNLSDKPAPVPPVRVKLLDGTLQQFDSVLMPSGGLVVAPHAMRTLVFDVSDPDNMAMHVDLDFDRLAMKKMLGQVASRTRPSDKVSHPAPASEDNDDASTVAEATPARAGPDPIAAEVLADDDQAAGDAPVSTRPTPPLRPALPTTSDAAPQPAHAEPAASLRTKPQHS